MPTNLPIRFLFAGLPAEYCIESAQRFALDIAAGMSGYVPGTYSFINYGNTEPAPEDRDKPWVRLNGDGSLDRVYVYFNGFWSAPNPRTPDGERIWWAKAENLLWSYDGGDGSDPSAVTPTAFTGAMWQRDADYDAKFPLQSGTLPSGTTVNIGDTGGEENHTATDLSHIHVTGRFNMDTGSNPDHWYGLVGTGAGPSGLARQVVGATSGLVEADINTQAGKYTIDSVPLNSDLTPHAATPQNNMPPYRVGFWAKRTVRTSYVP